MYVASYLLCKHGPGRLVTYGVTQAHGRESPNLSDGYGSGWKPEGI
jgi:hypothetical protein